MPLLVLLLDAYTLVVFVSVVLSWLRLSPYNPVVRLVGAITEPVLTPIRKVLPAFAGFDFSALVLLLGLQLVRRLLLAF